MNKYVKTALYSFQQRLKERSQLFGRLLLITVLVQLFSQIFDSVSAEPNRLWYFMMTEIIMISTSPLVIEIMQDIRSQKILYHLMHPINYCTMKICEGMGAAFFRFSVLLIWGSLWVSFIHGHIPFTTLSLASSIIPALFGIFLYTLISIIIGLSSFWIRDVKTLLYMNLTATFCFGGLIVPISFYPPIMQTFCSFTPYPWILWLPATIFSGGSVSIGAFAAAIGWALLLLYATYSLFNLYRNRLITEGG